MAPETMSVEAKLALDRFTVDEAHAHIVLKDEFDDAEFDKLVLCCPAGLYKRNSSGEPTFDHAGCLECGTCRILGDRTVVGQWVFPAPGRGVEYRY